MSVVEGGDLVFRVVVDDSSVPAAATTTKAAMDRLGASANSGQKQFEQLGKQSGLTAFQMQNLGYQMNDFFVQVYSGQSVLTAFVQQGSQLTGTFGGAGNALKAVLSLLTPARVLFGALAATVGAVGLGIFEGYRLSEAFGKSIQATGNFAGLTAGQFNSMALSIAQLTNRPISAAREVLQELVSTGQVGPQALQPMAQAVLTLAKVTGQSTADIVKDFAGMSNGVAKWALDHNRSLHYITTEQYKYIRSLEAQGKVEEAMRVNSQILDAALKDRSRNLGFLESAWDGVKNVASRAWDAMLGLGREATLEAQIEAATKDLDNARLALGSRGGKRDSTIKAEVEQKAESLRLLKRLSADKQTLAGQEAADAAKTQRELEQQQSGFLDATLAKERAALNQGQALREYAREQERIKVERQYDLLEISGQTYLQRRIALERAGVDAKEQAINGEIALEKKRPVGTPQEALSQQAKLIELETKRIGILGERAKLEDRIRRGELYRAGPAELESANQQFRKLELAQSSAVETGIADRKLQSEQAAHDLLEVNRDLGIQLVLDDRRRGEMQIAVEEEAIRKRIDLAGLSAADRERIEDSIATWRLLRERQLTEDLKPEYQRQLDLFADTVRYMRQASDEFRKGFIDSGRDAFTQWVQTGKLSTTNLVQFIQQKFASIFYDRYLSRIFDQVGTSLFSSLFGGGGGLSLDTGGIPINNTGDLLPTAGGSGAGTSRRAAGLSIGGGTGTGAARPSGRGGDVFHITLAPVFQGNGVSRNELMNGMALARDAAVTKIAELRRRGNRTVL